MDHVAVRNDVANHRLVHDHRTMMDFGGHRRSGGHGGEG